MNLKDYLKEASEPLAYYPCNLSQENIIDQRFQKLNIKK